MNTTFTYAVLTPAAELASGEATYAQIPGVEGSFGVLAGHAPLVSLLAENQTLVITAADGSEARFQVHGGVADVSPTSLVILAESATAA